MIPVLDFRLRQGQSDALYESMFDRNNGKSTDMEQLNWGGTKDPKYKQRRTDAKCNGFCTEVNTYLPPGIKQECDEYPPASTKQGGPGASRKCIPATQNSGFQSHMIRIFASKTRCNLKMDDPFIIRMKDGCSYLGLTKRWDGITTTLPAQPSQLTIREDDDTYSYAGLKKRQNETSTTSSAEPSQLSLSGFNDTLMSIGDDNNTPSWIAVGLDELPAGTYAISVPLEFQITELVVLDGEGVEYASAESPSGLTTLNFTLDYKLDTGASLIAVTDRKMNISYTATGQLSTVTAPLNSNSAGSHFPLLMPVGLIVYIFLLMGIVPGP
ncbi:hypothetical protein D9758_004458 [Tetrapyrgos nigripes]|uniref:Deoxyribonuclease NucA/NucB domain-containing protein n=1 Tax=Tetrapyrgos nigripes TaxID=182062 RepID=A0A8H5GNC1_9AGAR|nr:hypothetical protein D9758_004458 [Tetrapyrgos nigripes]